MSNDQRAERYLGPVKISHQVTYLRSPRDTAKTTRIVEIIKALVAAKPNARVLVPVHRQSLVSSYMGKLGVLGFKDYRETPGYIGEDRVVICADSLRRLALWGPQDGEYLGELTMRTWDFVFIDESEQFIQHLDGATVAKNSTPEEVVTILRNVFQSTRQVVLADADLGSLTLCSTRRLMGWDTDAGSALDEHFINNEVTTDRAADMYSSLVSLDFDRREWWLAGEKLAIFCTTKSEAKRISLDMESERTGAKVILITSDTSADFTDLIRDPDAWIAKHQPDALIYSPSLGTGVDVAIKDYFDRVLAYVAVGPWTTVYDALQGLERVRHPKVRERAIWVDSRAIWGCTDPRMVRRRLLVPVERDVAIATKHYPLDNGTFIPVPRDKDTADILVDIRVHRARAQGHIGEDMVREMVRLGWSLRWVSVDYGVLGDEEAKRIRQLKWEEREAQFRAIVEADPLDSVEEAQAVLDARDQATDEEIASARKTLLLDFTGLNDDEVDMTLVREWLSGRLGSAVETFVAVLATLQRGENLRALSARQVAKWQATSKGRAALFRGRLFAAILRAYVCHPTIPVDHPPIDHRDRWVTAAEAPMTILPPPPATLDIIGGLLPGFGVLGMRVRPDWRQSPFEVLRVALREIGIRGQRRRRQVRLEAGAREWVLKGYEVDADGLNKITC